MIYSRNVLGVHIFHKKKQISVSEKQVRKSTRGLIPGGEVAISKPRLISYNNRCFFVGNLHLSTARNADRIG